ncbi:hypothetical protein NONO_c05880 [Nocardia nova SH22a]|uniref:Uncharacterized protein n=1 Tax=Nocardia nova SH22a TaxID=1415166 RepID=W5T7X1_9NOCA|nr:hypothetical protein [Nocardia nova]AHH15400.1 hypothetical protein NONO_c05880 [Nocardia nova SH22a]
MTGPAASHPVETAEQTRNRRFVNVIVVVVLVALAIVGLLVFEQKRDDARAAELAQVLHDRLVAAGLPAPEPDRIADTLGDDGGLICSDPSSPLVAARYRDAIATGAAGPGNRPVILDRDVLAATEIAVRTYCPDHLPAYLDRVARLRLGDTAK